MEKVRVRHILVDSFQKAYDLSQELMTESDFINAAEQYSNCPSRVNGGDLGEISRDGQVVKPFLDAAFSLGKMEISEPVETQFGYHVIMRTS